MAELARPTALLSPLDLHGLPLANRVVMAPLTRGRAGQDRVPTDVNAEYYRQRASAGLIITEATTISPQANGWLESAGIYTDVQQQGWAQVAEAVHQAGGKLFMQLWHTGRASHSSFHDGAPPVAPSAIAIQGDHAHTPDGKQPYETPRALETDELPGIVADYKQAAQRAKDAGLDGVEVHSANGYLLDEFLQSKTNHRDDQYGGSVENRFRLLGEVLAAVTEVWDSTRIGVRLSPNGVFNDMGSPDYREQFTYAFEQLDKLNLAYLHVMDGLGFGFHDLGEPVTLAQVRQHYHGTLMGNCGYDRDSADQAVTSGAADLISFGRPYISNPDLAERFAGGWPLAPQAEMSDWYSPTGAKGYTDFPAYRAG